ncbi:DinB family protein [Pseudomonas sp. Ps21-P2]|uniref:DinB family protein n=1 Tax=Pseudomonas sp. Ps21-P2 TaxID=3080331 RepID=UPI00320B6FB0
MNSYLAQAHNNRWSNRRLLSACLGLSNEEYLAPRTGFFPSIELTLRHILDVDQFYLAALTFDLEGQRKELPEHLSLQEIVRCQTEADGRLVTYCEGLNEHALGRRAGVVRAAGIIPERVDCLLLHLFQHQIHHRGQVHAMLSGTRIPPPQLDEFYLDGDLPLRASDELLPG